MEASKQRQPITFSNQRDRRIHLLEVIGNASKGGMECYIENLISRLPPDQFQVTCICPYESAFTSSLRKMGVREVFITPIADDPSWHSIQLTIEVAKLHQIDILHAHMPKAHLLAGIAGCLIHKPVLATIHGMELSAFELGVARAVQSYLITNCQEAYTQALALGVAPDHLTLVHNGIDTELFKREVDGVFRNSVNIPENVPLIGFVGRLDFEKGPDMFLRAAGCIHQLIPDAHFVIVGDGQMKDELEETCRVMKLEKVVHFLGWFERPACVYSSLDLLAHTSRSDGTSLVLLEAMSCGCPVIGLSVGGVREIIENDSTGYLSVAGDWEGLANGIVKMIAHPEKLKLMGQAGRKRMIEHFNLETNTIQIAEILRHIACADLTLQRFGLSQSLAQKIAGRTDQRKAN